MKESDFVDLSGEVPLWILHRGSAAILLALMTVHGINSFTHPAGRLDAAGVAGMVNEGKWFYGALAAVAVFHAVIGIRQLRRLCTRLWPPPRHRHFQAWTMVAERWCGLTLAAFLMLHLSVIGLSLAGVPALDWLIRNVGPAEIQAAEALLAGCLAMHVIGGVRVLIHEVFSTHRLDRPLSILAVACAAAAPLACLLRPV